MNFPSNLTANSTFYLGGEDWSGFGWSVQDTRKHFTLISPKHFVGARHFRPAVGSSVRFVNREGVVKDYTVAARHDIANDETPAGVSDLFVGELSEVIAEEELVSAVPFYNLDTEAEYVNEEIVMSGRNSRAAINTIAGFVDFEGGPGSGVSLNRGFSSTYTDPGFGGDRCYLVNGDSGGPSAVQTTEGFALVGTHSTVGAATVLFTTTYTNNDVFVPHYMERVDAVLEDDGYHVTRFNETLPELTFSVTESQDPAISSEGVSYLLTVANSATGEEAHNLKLELSCDGGATFASVSGSGWVVENGGTTLRALRGGLDSDETSGVTVVVDLPDEPEGDVTFSATLSADGSSDLSLMETTQVAQSFESWASELTQSGPSDDSDGDGVSNFMEYVLGRDGGVAEAVTNFSVEGGALAGTFTRRVYRELLGAEVALERSSDLQNWSEVEESEFMVAPLDSQLETVTFSELLGERAFFRFRASLPEGLDPE